VAWLVGKEDRTVNMAAEHFELSPHTVRRWARRSGTEAAPITYSPKDGPDARRAISRTPGGKYRAPVEDMGSEDRRRVVNTARTIAETVELGAESMLADLKISQQLRRKAIQNGKPAPPVLVSKDTAQAMLHLYRTLNLAVDTHPGLMKVAGIEESTDKGKRDLDSVVAALGLGEAKAAK